MRSHASFLALLVDGDRPHFLGTFATKDEAVAAVQKELEAVADGEEHPVAGVLPFEVVTAGPPAAAEEPDETSDEDDDDAGDKGGE